MPSVNLELAATQEEVLSALRHTASLYGVPLSGGPVYNIEVPTAAASDAERVAVFSTGIDPSVMVRLAIAPGIPSRVQLESHTPMFYFTSSQGFDKEAVVSVARTLRETVRAAKERRALPTFPAPGGNLENS